MKNSKKEKSVDMKIVHMIAIAVLMFGFPLLPPFGEMTPAGMHILGIFLGSIYGWCALDLIWPCILGFIALGLSGAVPLSTFFQSGFGGQLVVMTMCILFITVYISQTKLSDVIVSWLMTRKIAKGRPYVMIFLFVFAAFLVAIITNSFITAILFMQLYRTLANNAKIPPYHKLNSVMIAGIICAASLGDVALPFKSVLIVMMGGFSAATGIQINYANFVIYVFPALISIIMVYVLTCKFILRIDATLLSNVTDMSEFQTGITKKQKISLLFIFALLVALLLPGILPSEWLITIKLNALGMGGIAFVVLLCMMTVRVDGEPLLDIREMGKGFQWDVLIITAYFTPLAGLLVADDYGLKATLSTVFQPIVSSLSAYTFVVAIVVIAAIATNFLNNQAVGILFISMLAVLGDSLVGVNLYATAIMIMIAAVFSMAMPSANPVCAYLFSQRDLIHFKDHAIHAWICCFVLIGYTCTVLYLFLNLVL